MEGFAVLIEKDWIGFGHKFKDRLGESHEGSPVFHQFLDCVWQLTEQFPDKFQFNERFLKHISTHCQTNWFSTFICNSDKERKERMMTMKAANTSGSGSEINKHRYTSARELPIWSLLLANRAIYSNPRYNQEREMNPEKLKKMLLPIPSVKVLQIWTGMYLKYDESLIGHIFRRSEQRAAHDLPSLPSERNTIMWEPDNWSTTCHDCGNNFTWYIRRHHCRACGRLFCHRCSSQNMALPQLELYTPVRVCERCADSQGKVVGQGFRTKAATQQRRKNTWWN
mmetsp:Transcript_870/g.1114  ORF Transcript_870/g.1114 Transcript_870/m.1114 type:complete len:282 (-) Transcript_870:195-1040(-)